MSLPVSVTKSISSSTVTIGLIVLGLIVWIDPTSFLWRDDWRYLMWFRENNYALLRGAFESDIKPLFQYVMFAEFTAGGTRFYLYQIFNVFLIIGSSVCILHLSEYFGLRKWTCIIVSVFYLLHPDHFINAFWISQQCELFHILFIQLAIIAYLQFIKNHHLSNLLWFSLFLVIQNYVFPNGTFLPILFIGHYLYNYRSDIRKSILISCSLILLLHVAFAIYIGNNFLSVQKIEIFNDLPERVFYFIKLISVSAWRVFIPNYSGENSWVLTLAPLVVGTVAIAWLFIRKLMSPHYRNILSFAFLGLLISSITLVLTRYQQMEIHYYYTTLHLTYLCLLLGVCIDPLLEQYRKASLIASICLLAAFIFADYKGKQIFATRNILNKDRMTEALLTNSPYLPVDDPALELEGYIIVNGNNQLTSATLLYKFLQDE